MTQLVSLVAQERASARMSLERARNERIFAIVESGNRKVHDAEAFRYGVWMKRKSSMRLVLVYTQ